MRWLILAYLVGCSCATTGNHNAFDRCEAKDVMLACNPADHPPLTAMLPPWPFPRLVEVPPEPQQPNDTPASRLLQKLGR